MTKPKKKPPEVVTAAEHAILDSAVGLAWEWRPDVQGDWEEDGYRLPAEEYVRLMSYLQRLIGGRQLQVLPSSSLITVVAPNRPGLLSLVAGTLAVHGLGVRSAAVVSGEGGVAVAVIELESDREHPADWDHVRFDLLMVLEGQMCLDTRLAQLISVRTAARLSVATKAVDTQILIDNTASATTTMVEVRTVNSFGSLYRITKALAERGLDVSTARVSTVDDQLIDCFYVTDAATGTKICDPIAMRDIESAVLRELCHERWI